MTGDVELRETVRALGRRWWLILGLPLVVLIGSVVRTADRPYVATVRATVLIPGDTEVPGSAERPELMVLDDVPVLVRSRVFAEAVAAAMAEEAGELGLGVDEIGSALSGERYSRVVTIRARHRGRREALAIAAGAAAALPGAVDRYLVAPGGLPATVRVIDPARRAVRDDADRVLIVTTLTLVGFGAGLLLAALAAGLDAGAVSVRAGRADRG